VLTACRRVLRPGGRLAFYTIFIPQGLSETDYRRAARSRSVGITCWRREHKELLNAAGFVDIQEMDFTDEYLRVTRQWGISRQRHADALRRAEGEASFEQSAKENRSAAAAIEAKLLRRSLFVAQRP